MTDKDSQTENLSIERIYQLIKQKLEDKKKDNELLIDQNFFNQNNFSFYKDEIKNSVKYIPFNEKTNWNYSTFSTSINERDIEFPEILSNSWTAINININNGMDITNKIFECEETINYKIVNNFIKANILLEGDGMFWIFLHSNHKFDDNTIAILFEKKDYSQKVFMCIGSFINSNYINSSKNSKGNNFHIFQKQQLIKNYNDKAKNKKETDKDKYQIKDSCLIKITIIDEGYEMIKIISKLNDGEEDNELIGRMHNPVAYFDNSDQYSVSSNNADKNYRVMIAGNGTSCKINSFYCETKLKNIFENKVDMGEVCQCCEIS